MCCAPGWCYRNSDCAVCTWSPLCLGSLQSQHRRRSYMEARSKTNLELLKARDPCYDESVLSLKCLEAGDKESCEKEISNYKKCKKFWYDIYNFRKFHGIKPFLPEPNDRKNIKESYLQKRNFKLVCDEILQEDLKNKTQ